MTQSIPIEAVNAHFGGRWTAVYERRGGADKRLVVVQRGTRPQDVVVLENKVHPEAPSEETLALPDGEIFTYRTLLHDPGIPGLSSINEHFSDLRVIRYRPSKRVTFSATDNKGNVCIVKCLGAQQAAGVFESMQKVFALKDELPFSVSRPLLLNKNTNVLVQSLVAGESLRSKVLDVSFGDFTSMARCIKALHDSNALFSDIFRSHEQFLRSWRYRIEIENRFPVFASRLDRLWQELEACLKQSHRQNSLKPIHGSLHSHQWLLHEKQLGLIDFDRAAMGHPENDIGTFLAEWDFEKSRLGEYVKSKFSATLNGYDERLIAFYRAHKHLAEAFKASKRPNESEATARIHRNLASATAIAQGTIS